MRESVEDIRKKFRGTYCFLELNGKKHLTEFYDDNGEDAFYFKSPEFGEIIVDRETVDTCMTHSFPSNGLYNVQGQAINFVRYPERQWRRAPYRDNCRMTPILTYISININSRALEINLHNLEELYRGSYPTNLESAILSLKYSTAVNKDFAVSRSTSDDKNEYILWYHTQPVGIVKSKEKTIEVVFEPLYQEVQDYIRKQEPTWLLTKKQQS